MIQTPLGRHDCITPSPLGVVALSISDARAQSRGPVGRGQESAKDLEVLAMRTRVVTDDGALVVYDAPRAEGEPREQGGDLDK